MTSHRHRANHQGNHHAAHHGHHEQVEAVEPRLLIVGPQGSGKGTQSARIAATLGIPAISTGDLFRAAITGGTALGTKVKAIIDAGELVSDELTFDVVRERLLEGDAGHGFLLDGFPRNLAQVSLLDHYLAERDEPITAVIELDVPREVSIARLEERAREQGRTDDTEEAIAKRLAIYESETAPILSVYRERGLVDGINGVGSMDAIAERIVTALAARGIRA